MTKRVLFTMIVLILSFGCNQTRVINRVGEEYPQEYTAYTLALEYSTNVFPDNVDPADIKNPLISTAVRLSNESFERVLNFSSWTSDIAIVTIPLEKWAEYQKMAGVKNAGGFCGIREVTYGKNRMEESRKYFIAMPSTDVTIDYFATLSHERVHCSMGARFDETTSQFGAFLLTIDQAMVQDDYFMASDALDKYVSLDGYDEHIEGKMRMFTLLNEESPERDFSSLVATIPEFFRDVTDMAWSDKELVFFQSQFRSMMGDFERQYIRYWSKRYLPYCRSAYCAYRILLQEIGDVERYPIPFAMYSMTVTYAEPSSGAAIYHPRVICQDADVFTDFNSVFLMNYVGEGIHSLTLYFQGQESAADLVDHGRQYCTLTDELNGSNFTNGIDMYGSVYLTGIYYYSQSPGNIIKVPITRVCAQWLGNNASPAITEPGFIYEYTNTPTSATIINSDCSP